MKEDEIQHLFQLAKEEPSEVQVEEVTNWITLAAAATGTAALFSILKYKYLLLTKKGVIMIGTFFATVGISSFLLLQHDATTEKENKPYTNQSVLVSTNSITKKQHQTVKLQQQEKLDLTNTSEQNNSNKIVESVPEMPLQLLNEYIPLAVTPQKITKTATKPFNKVYINGMFDVIISQGDSSYYSIEEGHPGDADKVKIAISNESLSVEMKKAHLDDPVSLTIFITVKDLSLINCSGISKITSTEIHTENLTIQSTDVCTVNMSVIATNFTINDSGAGNYTIDLEAKNVFLNDAGASTITFSGKCNNLSISDSGVCHFNSLLLEADQVVINSSGSGNSKVYALNSLTCNITGFGQVYYKGSPTDISVSKGEFGKFKKL